VNVLDVFSGIGGFSLGLERTGGFRTVAFCEIDPFARRVLAKHWPEIPCYEDVRTLTAQRLAADGLLRTDVVCGGFPCQPFSTASRGRRVAIDMWPEMLRVIREVMPRYVIAENVQEAAIANAARDIGRLGYGTYYRRISADDVGADHQRNRWWLCAYADDKSELHRAINAEMAELSTLCRSLWGPTNYARAIRIPNGVSNRMERLIALGNAVMPTIPEAIGRAIMAAS
jgi:DNA (cytosine-5)-methyltransferase 1